MWKKKDFHCLDGCSSKSRSRNVYKLVLCEVYIDGNCRKVANACLKYTNKQVVYSYEMNYLLVYLPKVYKQIIKKATMYVMCVCIGLLA